MEPAWLGPGGGGRLERENKGPVSTVFPSLVDADAIKKSGYKPWRALVVLFEDELGK